MSVKKFMVCLGLNAMALVGTAVTADASQSGQASPCREPVGAAGVFGRSVHLWLCDDGWHGQITNGATGDEIWLDSAAGTVTNWTTIPPGNTVALIVVGLALTFLGWVEKKDRKDE